MVGLLFNELKRKWKIVGVMAIILIAYVLIMGLMGKYDNFILPGNYLISYGASNNIVTFMMMILASVAFAGSSSRTYLFKMGESHHTFTIYLAQILSLVVEYVFLIGIDVLTVLGVQKYIFMGKALGPNHIAKMVVSIQANAYYMAVLLPLIIIVTMGIKSNINAIATGIATNYIGLVFAYILTIWVYGYRYLKWNPFNSLMIEGQIIKPINHTLTKLHNNEAIAGALIYSCIYLILILWIFGRRQKIHRLKN